jgi:hypothetical protein
MFIRGLTIFRKEVDMKKLNEISGTKLKVSDIISSDKSSDLSSIWLKRRGARSGRFIWNDAAEQPQRFKLELYRFLRDNVPLLNSCIWTWSRLASAPGRYELIDPGTESERKKALVFLDELLLKIYPYDYHKMAGLESFLPLFFDSLFTDGAFSGFAIINRDASGVEKFLPIDPSYLILKQDRESGDHFVIQHDGRDIRVDGDDFYYFGLSTDVNSGIGRSILSAVPFIAYIEQQLIDDMRRTTHNAGYHRLHVQITPPEKQSGESDSAYIDRINDYFDETISMIKGAAPEDNPVTWDNVKIEYIGPRNVHGVTNAWFLNHRTMVEEICAGTNLSPFMLGYSYGTTHNWAQFKYDLVMRQVVSIQNQTSRFLEWLGNIELALKGMTCKCRFVFDNRLTYLATEQADIERGNVDNLIKLYTSGLIDKETAFRKAGDLL